MPPTSSQAVPVQAPTPFRLLTGGKAQRHTALGTPLVVILVFATLFRLWMAAYGSQGLVSDEVYAVLRQGRHWMSGQGFVFQPGIEAGLSQPLSLFALLVAPLQALLGGATPAFLIAFNTVLWTCAVLALLRPMRPSVRPALALLLCLAPAFVDGAIRGSSAEWIGFLLAMSYAAISAGQTARSILWLHLAILSNPSMALFLPVWIGVHTGRLGVRFGSGTLLRWRNALAVLAPIGVWTWLSGRSADDVFWLPVGTWLLDLTFQWRSIGDLWLGLPSFSLLPWIADMPLWLQHVGALVTWSLLAGVTLLNLRTPTIGSRGWLAFFYLMLAFGTGEGLDRAGHTVASILPGLALVMSMVPFLLPLVPRFHETRLLRGTAVVLLTLAMPIAFGTSLDLRAKREDFRAAVEFLRESPSESTPGAVMTVEAAHFGFLYDGPMVDPLDTPLRPNGTPITFTQIARLADCDWILVRETSLASNLIPGIGPIWSTESDHVWWNAHTRREATFGAWHLYRVNPPGPATQPPSSSPAKPAPTTNVPG